MLPGTSRPTNILYRNVFRCLSSNAYVLLAKPIQEMGEGDLLTCKLLASAITKLVGDKECFTSSMSDIFEDICQFDMLDSFWTEDRVELKVSCL
jgi:hypothetical protein